MAKKSDISVDKLGHLEEWVVERERLGIRTSKKVVKCKLRAVTFQSARHTLEARVNDRFQWLCADLHTSDLESLMAMPFLGAKISIYDYVSQTTQPAEGVLPWPVLWFLSRTHPKHVFAGPTPKPDRIALDVKNFLNKISWRAALKEDQFDPPFRLSRPKYTIPCHESVPTGIKLWSDAFLDKFMEQYEVAYRRLGGPGRATRTSRLISWAKTLLHREGFTVVMSDKDGGFVAVPLADMEHIEANVFANTRTYHYEDSGLVSSTINAAIKATKVYSDAVAVMEGKPELSRYMMRPSHRRQATPISRLGITLRRTSPRAPLCLARYTGAPTIALKGSPVGFRPKSMSTCPSSNIS